MNLKHKSFFWLKATFNILSKKAINKKKREKNCKKQSYSVPSLDTV